MGFEDAADSPGIDQGFGFQEVRHAPLLGANLDDLLVAILGLDHSGTFHKAMRERLLDVHILPRVTGIDRHRDVPVVGRTDQDRVQVFASRRAR